MYSVSPHVNSTVRRCIQRYFFFYEVTRTTVPYVVALEELP